jgi:hypothetical protein
MYGKNLQKISIVSQRLFRTGIFSDDSDEMFGLLTSRKDEQDHSNITENSDLNFELQ